MASAKPRTPTPKSSSTDAPPKKRALGLYTIIAVKLGKALLLAAVAFGLFSLMNDDLPDAYDRVVRALRLNPEWEFLNALGKQLHTITPSNLGWLSGGSLLYSLLLFVETVGLMRRAYWAVWLAIGETAFFIPIEIFDLVRHPTGVVEAILVLNVLIVIYLAWNRERLFHHHRVR
jgi:uncharacterized membrane protein (DUF2068 family)